MAQIKLTREQTKALAHFLQFGHWPLFTTTKATKASERARFGMLRRLEDLGLVEGTCRDDDGTTYFELTPLGRTRAQSVIDNRVRCAPEPVAPVLKRRARS